MRRLTDWLAYLIVRVFVCLIQALSLEACQTISRLLAHLACDIVRLRHEVVDENLRCSFPCLTERQRRDFARRMWEHLFLMVCEIAHAPRKVHDTNWRRYLYIHRKPEMVGYLLDPRPVVLVSGHFGNFEITSYVAGLMGFPTYAIARPLDNPYLDRYVNQFRCANGQFILPKDGSAGQIDEVLRGGGAIALLGDQSAGPKGCWVQFMGRPASSHKAVALFTLVSGAPLLVSYGKRTGGPLQFEIGLEAVADPQSPGEELAGVKSLTQWYNTMLERVILSAPEQYWWVHRRWKGEPHQKRRKRKPKAAASRSGQQSVGRPAA
jgi:KDO2-lipid IV(A) lauroyltransferase